jgi:putative flippase GtrA
MALYEVIRSRNFGELWRFYQAAVINTAFGYGLFALLITIHVPLFAAQAIAFICGASFNYIVYSRHVFRTGEPAKMRFLVAYALNYAINLALLFLTIRIASNAYVAGAIASFVASLINYFFLKYTVFLKPGSSR